ncbi:invasion associated locus B family protein [Aestuariivirga sp.]|jgi:invasion protein IalB|uniref:invasion associated locus B family protein n=1 Tax=Aestuariivirga sp. TaxID=2650926 RepID=UPI003784CDCE
MCHYSWKDFTMIFLNQLSVLSLGMVAIVAAVSDADATTRIEKTFSGWKVECVEADDGKSSCGLQYALATKKDKAIFFSWSILRDARNPDSNKVILRTPTGVLLQKGIDVGFEGAEPVKVNYLTCGPRSCVAEFDFTDKWAEALASNEKIEVNYVAANGKPLKHQISLKQFSEAFEFYNGQLKSD